MAETVEMAEIRGLDIDKTVKGFALIDYTFKNECTVSSTSADHIRWYQETSADLTATAPAYVANISPLSIFPTLEPSWTRQTSYVKKYAAESFMSMEDMKSADIDVLARTALRLTRAVLKQVDTRIYDVMSGASIQTMTVTAGGWNVTSGAIIHDILKMKRLIGKKGYNPQGASLILAPEDVENMTSWLIDTKGSSIPQFSSEKVRTGVIMNILGVNVKESVNATSGAAILIVPKVSLTWKTHTPITSRVIEEPGIGSKFRVWELGEAYQTDPNACVRTSGLYT